MPKAFEKCVKKGGRVRTRKLKDDKYQHMCFLDGKAYLGYEKKKKKRKGK